MLSPENKLWVAVFERAWEDLHGRVESGSTFKGARKISIDRVQAQAAAYFRSANFRHDCHLNGWEPEWVLKVLAEKERDRKPNLAADRRRVLQEAE